MEASEPKADTLAEDLFGDDDQVMSERPARPAPVEDDSSDVDSLEDPEKSALEYREEDEAPPAPVVEEQTAWLNLAQAPVRRTKPTMIARLPNFVRYSDEPFDAATWSEQREEDMFQSGSELGDKDARSILRTSNTMRWRWKKSEKGVTPQSNARIVRWSDGSESLQLGAEFFDVTKHAESSAPTADGGKVPLTYLFVPHAKEGVLQAEGPVRTALTFKPNLNSETHQKLASAIKHQRSARVVAGQEMFGLDAEREKERIERQLKESERKRQRERNKAMRDDDDYDELGLNARRHGARGASQRSRVYADFSDDDVDAPRAQRRNIDYDDDDDDDDGFIVHDETDEEQDAPASDDETDLADRNIEAFERKRREEREADMNRGKRALSEE